MGETKVALITENSTGIGLSAALQLAAKGSCKVYLVIDRDCSFKASDERSYNDNSKHNLIRRETNFRSDSELTDTVSEILSCEGRIDFLVLDTGVGSSGPVESFSVSMVGNLLETNVYSVIRVLKLVLPLMRAKQAGHVLLISSTDGIWGTPFHSVPCLTKFAIEGLAQSLAVEMCPFNIRISLVQPGPILGRFPSTVDAKIVTPRSPCDHFTESLYQLSQDKQVGILKTMGQRPEDVAGEIVRAISSQQPHFRYITNKLYFSAVSNKLIDHTGDATMTNTIEKFVS